MEHMGPFTLVNRPNRFENNFSEQDCEVFRQVSGARVRAVQSRWVRTSCELSSDVHNFWVDLKFGRKCFLDL